MFCVLFIPTFFEIVVFIPGNMWCMENHSWQVTYPKEEHCTTKSAFFLPLSCLFFVREHHVEMLHPWLDSRTICRPDVCCCLVSCTAKKLGGRHESLCYLNWPAYVCESISLMKIHKLVPLKNWKLGNQF